MEGSIRRKQILEMLNGSPEPISGSELSKHLGVSRQVIVQDIALLRAVDKNILSTTKGYILYQQKGEKVNRCFLVKHTKEQIEDELCTIVDNGGVVLNVIVTHQIYGEITADLLIKTRKDIYDFVKKVEDNNLVPLKDLTGDVHYHTVEADSKETLDQIEEQLQAKNYIYYL